MDTTFSATDIADDTWVISPERNGHGTSNYIYTCSGKDVCSNFYFISKSIIFYLFI